MFEVLPKATEPPPVVGRLSVFGTQVGLVCRKSVVFHKPPPEVSRYTVFTSAGSGRIVRARPLSTTLRVTPLVSKVALVGPMLTHLTPELSLMPTSRFA